ncbi:MAG TPA: glycerol-3-phosphate dehydrogenase/oxidase [bacterium]
MTDTRTQVLGRLAQQQFDLLVIGGGIVGAGVARDAAMRGLEVALVEQGDFAGGTSSKTSKLIHGGLRYLEHGQLGLVRESVRERRVLREVAPGLVRPLALLLPAYAGDPRPAWKLRAGLWLYDLLAWGRTVQPHRILSARRALAMEPTLSAEELRGAGLYGDCQMDDARLCLANVLQAKSFGAACANYVRVQSLIMTVKGVCGAAVEDTLAQQTFDIRARVVVNATGPWSDVVRRLSVPDAPRRLAPTKGIHVVLPRIAERGLFLQSGADGRMVFVLPWGRVSLVGTTESTVDAPLEHLRAYRNEVGYLLELVNRRLPGAHVSEQDVIGTFAGARPLLSFSGRADAASREHRIEIDRRGLISVMGGKYTTYRRMAQQVADLVAKRVGRASERCLTDQVSLIEELLPVSLEHWRGVTAKLGPETLARLLTRYGVGTSRIVRCLAEEPALASQACAHHALLDAELTHAIREEAACTVTDVLARRTSIAWSSCHGLDLVPKVVTWLRVLRGVSEDEGARQADDYRRFIAESTLERERGLRVPDGSAHPASQG